jgi:Bacterial Ig domain
MHSFAARLQLNLQTSEFIQNFFRCKFVTDRQDNNHMKIRATTGALFTVSTIILSLVIFSQHISSNLAFGLTADNVLIFTEKNNVVHTFLSSHETGGQDYSIVTGPQVGMLNIAGRLITYIPKPGFVGIDTFTYHVENGKGDVSNTAKVTVNVREPTPPQLMAQIYPTATQSTFEPDIKIMKTFDARKFMRQYTDKPDEPSVEAVVDSHIPFINQEFSGYIKLKSMIKPEPIEIVVRGGMHSSGYRLQGTSYHVELMTDGSTKKKLEVERPHHTLYDASSYVKPLFVLPNLVGKTFGFKVISYVTSDNNVKLECYLDLDGLKSDGTPANNWKKYFELTDSGQLPQGKITMPYGTLSMIRIDNIKETPDFFYLNNRQISTSAGMLVQG